MARPLVSNDLWELVEPLIPECRGGGAFRGASASTTARC
jgi:hypothetical protein